MPPGLTYRQLDALEDAMIGRTIEGIHIHDAIAQLTESIDDEPVVRVTMRLDDPVPDRSRWPREPMHAISDTTRDEAIALGIDESVWVLPVPLSHRTDFFQTFRRR